MGLSERLAAQDPQQANRGCRTCQWLAQLDEPDRAAFHDWLATGYSLTQLYRVCVDDPDHPYPVSFTALRNHVRDCK